MYLTPMIALLSLAIASFTLMKAGWSPENKPTDILGWAGFALLVLAVLLLLAVLATSRKRGPAWMRDIIDGWLSPADSKWYPDMKLLEVIMRVAPQFVTDHTKGTVVAEAQERTAETLRAIGRLASLGKLQVFGKRKDATMGTVQPGWTRIPDEFWTTGEIHYSDFILDTSGKASRRVGGDREEIYVNIELDSRQVRKSFTREGATKVRFQKPWVVRRQ